MTDMAFTEHDTCRARTQRLLTTSHKPLTAQQIADQLATTAHQAQRALRQLEAAGHAQRTRGHGNQPGEGRAADRWTAR